MNMMRQKRKKLFNENFNPPHMMDIIPVDVDDVVKALLKTEKNEEFWLACGLSEEVNGLLHIWRSTPYKIDMENSRGTFSLINVKAREASFIKEAIQRNIGGCEQVLVLRPEKRGRRIKGEDIKNKKAPVKVEEKKDVKG